MANAATAVTSFSTAPTISAGNAICQAWTLLSSESVAASTSIDSVLSTAGPPWGVHIPQGAYFGLWVQCTSTGTAKYTVQLLQSFNDTTGNYVQPDVPNLVPGSTSGSTAFADNSPHVIGVFPVPMPLGILRITNNQTTAALSANAVLFAVR